VIPAALFLDSVRFQFRDATERVAWSVRAGVASALALELAAASKNPGLVADLVETHINSVVHGPRTGGDGDPEGDSGSGATMNRLVSTRATGIELIEAAGNGQAAPFTFTAGDIGNPEGGTSSGEGVTAAGTTQLLGSAGLPGTPPPPLLIPSRAGERMALASWHGQSRYPAIQRPSTPIRTW
jgi:hypothetical protein